MLPYKMCLALFIAMTLTACRSLSPELLRPDKIDTVGKLMALEIGKANTEKVAFENTKTVSVQSYLYTIFERELESNIFLSGAGKHGSIELNVIYIDQATGMWVYLAGLTLGITAIIGLPAVDTRCKLETDIRIYDKRGTMVKKYNYFKESKMNWSIYGRGGVYYTTNDAETEHTILLFREIMKNFRADISGDAANINLLLGDE
jgi:hypothetical protein